MSQRLDTPTRALSRPETTGPREGTLLADRYQLIERIGDGAMGSVYLAEHVQLRRKVAVKILHAELSRLPEVVARFEREAVAAANIDHPNVAAAFDFGSLADGTFFLALEYVEGDCLRDAITGPMPAERAVRIAEQIARALERAHSLGIVHRDLKPENIMLVDRHGDPDFVKVLDFGIARVRMGEDDGATTGKALTRAGMVYGTPEYMAPEQALGLPVDARADLYALGIMLFEMLTGLRPFVADNAVVLLGMQVTAPLPRFEERAPNVTVPIDLQDIVYKLTAKATEDRFADASEVADALAQIDPSSTGGRVRINPHAGRSSEPPSRRASARSEPTAQRGDRPKPAQGVEPSGRTMFTASGEANDARLLLGSIRSILVRTWHEIKPLFFALWLKIPERYRTRRIQLAVGGGLATLTVVLLLVMVFSGGAQATADTREPVSAEVTPPNPEVTMTAARKALADLRLDEARQLIDGARLDPAQTTELRQRLVLALFRTGRRVDALRQLETLYNVNPASTEIAEMAVEIERALISTDGGGLAFAYLESHPSNLGADVLYKIVAEATASKPVVERATKMLTQPFVREHASPAVLVAADLRAAGKICKKLQALLTRARDFGDARALPYLYAAEKPVIVTKRKLFASESKDLLACLRQDDVLAETITAIERRTGTVRQAPQTQPEGRK